MELCTAKNMDYVKALYFEAFPKAERKPFSVIEKMRDEGICDILEIKENGKPCGLAVAERAEGCALLDYFAVDPGKRGGGIGGRALEQLCRRYSEGGFFLEIESTFEKSAGNMQERISRKRFYLNRGFFETGCEIMLYGVRMELLSCKHPIPFEVMDRVYRRIYAEVYNKAVKRL